MTIHDKAARGFERGAADYEAGRPSYPAAAIERLVAETGIDETSTVVDLAAGTGKLTRLLVPTGATVVAVEPVAGMRAALQRQLPDVRTYEGTAESIPIPDQSADVVTAGQAFHWFAHRGAVDEIARALRTGGWLALVWNTRDPSQPWTARIDTLLEPLRGDAPKFRPDDETWHEPIDASPDFEPLHHARFAHPVPMDPDRMVARVGSVSYVSSLADGRRAEVLDEVRRLTEAEGDGFVEQYVTDLYWCRRR